MGELTLLNWEGYWGQDTIANFEQEFGVKVNLENFASEEEMFSALQSQPERYDVVVASDSMVATLAGLKLLAPLSKEKLLNLENMEARFLGLAFDPENRYSVPYLWGTTGLAVNTRFIPSPEKSWKLLWDSAYQGRIAMLNDPQEVVGVALKLLGYSLNSRDPGALALAREKLLQQKPLLAGYLDPKSIMEGLVSGELWAAQLYNGDALSAAEDNPDIAYLLPEEGTALWLDNLVVPVGSPNQALAHTFISYTLRPGVAAAIASYQNYATPNRAAQEQLGEEIRANPAIYPDAETLEHSEFYQPLTEGANQALNRIWAELQAP